MRVEVSLNEDTMTVLCTAADPIMMIIISAILIRLRGKCLEFFCWAGAAAPPRAPRGICYCCAPFEFTGRGYSKIFCWPTKVGEDSEEALPTMMIVSELYDRTFCRTLASVVFAIIYISKFIPLLWPLIAKFPVCKHA